MYHKGCLNRWLNNSDYCPDCRAKLDINKVRKPVIYDLNGYESRGLETSVTRADDEIVSSQPDTDIVAVFKDLALHKKKLKQIGDILKSLEGKNDEE